MTVATYGNRRAKRQ